ncbi:hypothetical protein [Tateyamaria omphalii]|uniref:hypothetical protein n=1 Tax=Tateyamaria omphalii TaxID=299262 RepID=UPI0012F81329|nr:hypothetical protein [Tateyamaria omphalii]
MSDPDAYVALVASLPSSERLFVAKRPPLSRLRLERRLSALTARDAQILARIEGLLSWSAYDRASDLRTLVGRAKAVMADLPNRTLRRIVDERMELRTAVAALRMRHGGAGAPEGIGAMASGPLRSPRIGATLPLALSGRCRGCGGPVSFWRRVIRWGCSVICWTSPFASCSAMRGGIISISRRW